MSINWVMLDTSSKSFVPLPREKTLFTSASRTSLVLSTPNPYPGKEPLSIKCSDGKAYITNQRLIYLPAAPTSAFQSFQSPLLSLNDTHVTAPFFGPNVWEGILTPTAGGGIPAHHRLVQIKLTFKEGGAFDFSGVFERIKETVIHAAESARENGASTLPSELDLEQLPAYEEAVGSGGRSSHQPTASASSNPRPAAVTAQGYPDEKSASSEATASTPRPSRTANPAAPGPALQRPTPMNGNGTPNEQSRPTPNEPPPGYEEASEGSIARNLERQVRDE